MIMSSAYPQTHQPMPSGGGWTATASSTNVPPPPPAAGMDTGYGEVQPPGYWPSSATAPPPPYTPQGHFQTYQPQQQQQQQYPTQYPQNHQQHQYPPNVSQQYGPQSYPGTQPPMQDQSYQKDSGGGGCMETFCCCLAGYCACKMLTDLLCCICSLVADD